MKWKNITPFAQIVHSFNRAFATMTNWDGGLRLKIDGKWLHLTKEFISTHPGGSVLTQYSNADATHIFHAFHEGSAKAYRQLEVMKRTRQAKFTVKNLTSTDFNGINEINISSYKFSPEKEASIANNFEKLRQHAHNVGLMKTNRNYYILKTAESFGIVISAFFLQYFGWYFTSACFLALGWQQLGWLTHEYCHHQSFKNRKLNDAISLILGNLAQGISREWWKQKHNTHHAVTNIIGKDGDIDLSPLLALVPEDLQKYQQSLWAFFLKFVPYQHLYFVFTFPILRLSWVVQSIQHVLRASRSPYQQHRRYATAERITIAFHWIWVFVQLWLLPTFSLQIMYFIVSQMGAGFLIAHVVTYNHNSVDKLPENTPIINNFACLQILTTRNMRPSALVDWLWGGLNYQIEHHLFPTMPRSNLSRASLLVKQFCKENNLPYMVDDYFTGFKLNLIQLENVAKLSIEQQHCRSV